jgi:DNA-binding CsgD family transcriptional regulator
MLGRIPFVGRQDEWVKLGAFYSDALNGHGIAVLVSGELGIGKSRLIEEFAAKAASTGAIVANGRWYESEEMPAYVGFQQSLEQLLHMPGVAERLDRDSPYVQELARIIPQVMPSLRSVSRRSRVVASDYYRLSQGVNLLLRAASSVAPVILLLDDLHWADSQSLALFSLLGHSVKDGRILVLSTYRSEEVQGNKRFGEAIAELTHDRAASTMLLSGLSRDEVGALVVALTDSSTAEEFIGELYRQTEGNPLFLEGLLRHLSEQGLIGARERARKSIRPEDIAIPAGVRDLVTLRFNRLTKDARILIGYASVIGREFDLPLLAALSGLDASPLLEQLDEALQRSILRQTSHQYFSFSHPLFRTVAYQDLPLAQKRKAHLDLARALEQRRARTTQGTLPASPNSDGERDGAEIARHLLAAGMLAEPETTARSCLEGGRRESLSFAYQSARYLIESGLQVLDDHPNLDANGQLRCQLLLALAEAKTDVAEARPCYLQAAELAVQNGESDLLASAAIGLAGRSYNIGAVDREQVALLESSLEATAPDDFRTRALLLGRLCEKRYFVDIKDGRTDALERKGAMSQAALDSARKAGDKAALATVLYVRRGALWGPQLLNDRLSLIREGLKLGDELHDVELQLEGNTWLLVELLSVGDIPAADKQLELFEALADKHPHPFDLYQVLMRRAMRSLLHGRFEEAERFSHDFLTFGELADPEAARAGFTLQLFVLRREQGRLHELEAVIKSLVDQYPAVPAWRAALLYTHSQMEKHIEARAEFEELMHDLPAVPEDDNLLALLVALSEACAFLKDSKHARHIYDLLLPYEALTIVLGPAVVCYGAAAHYLAMLAATMEDLEQSELYFQQAIEMNEKLGAFPYVGHSQFEYARMLLARGNTSDRRRAQALLRQAESTFGQLGMTSFREQAQKLAIKRGRPLHNEHRSGLTKREITILRLLVQDRSNKEMAADLGISPKTVERHLATVYSKIGVSGRAAAAAFALREGIAE